ncbi:MAG: DUF2946 family protein [Aquabacterium sp.]|jgi:hypothetical protein|nr:MAG: DUF2946 family protein [Aquabacterium sp.]
MDEIVKAALKKWPNVPHCYDWLALDARGDWYMRDERIQAAGPFPQVKGSRITHDKLKDFIQRNYLADEHGAWFFQNGPQRVYVELEATPWIYGVQRQGQEWLVHTHTGTPAKDVKQVLLDEQGRLFLETELGLGIVHTLDMSAAADAVESGHWVPQDVASGELPGRYGYVLQPKKPAEPRARA